MSIRVVHGHDPWIFLERIESDVSQARDALEHQAGTHLLEQAVSSIGMDFSDYILTKTENGKPYFVKTESGRDIWVPCFNISHCRGYVACAVSRKSIGCDIEKIRPVSKYLCCELEKVRRIRMQEPHDEDEVTKAVRLWTIYESVAKCIGTGIPVDKKYFMKERWEIYSWMVERKYVLSIAQRG